MPFKHHAEHRHHIPKPRYRVTNWAEYDASLRRRGSLTVWFTDEAVAAWRAEPRTTPGGQPHYSALAISTALTMGMVFGLALREPTARTTSLFRTNRDGDAVTTRHGSYPRRVVAMWLRPSILFVPIGLPAPFSLSIPNLVADFKCGWHRNPSPIARQSFRHADHGQPGNRRNGPLRHGQILKSP